HTHTDTHTHSYLSFTLSLSFTHRQTHTHTDTHTHTHTHTHRSSSKRDRLLIYPEALAPQAASCRQLEQRTLGMCMLMQTEIRLQQRTSATCSQCLLTLQNRGRM